MSDKMEFFISIADLEGKSDKGAEDTIYEAMERQFAGVNNRLFVVRVRLSGVTRYTEPMSEMDAVAVADRLNRLDKPRTTGKPRYAVVKRPKSIRPDRIFHPAKIELL